MLGPGYLLTAHDGSWEPSASPHLRSGVEPILKHGPDHLLWALADDIVDGYFPFADQLGDAIDEVQDAVVRKTSTETLEQLFRLKRELIVVRRSISPVREVFNQLTSRDIELINDDELPYFRDIYDHVIRLTDELDNYRELASATLDVYLTTVNNNLSVIMKRLTGVTVILAGIGAVAGIFGMSEAGAALGGSEAGGFWLDHRGRRRDRHPGGRHPAQGRLDLGGPTVARRRYPQTTGCGFGCADAWSEASWESGSAITWSLPTVPCGPSEVCSQSCSWSALTASARLVSWRRTSLISYRNF